MKVYISGPMTGYKDFNRPRFNAAATELRAAGIDVVNPAEHGEDGPEKEWAEYLRADLILLLDCQGIAMLPGWGTSRGAVLERHVGTELGMDVRPLDEWFRP